MRIKFTYMNGEITNRDGVLLSVHGTASFALFLVHEDGVDHPKTFRLDRMTDIQTYPDRDPVEQALDSLALTLAEAADKALALGKLVREARK